MKIEGTTPEEIIQNSPEERREALNQLRNVIRKNLPQGFEEAVDYGMIGYVVPHSLYPNGYHCNPKQPLPFLGFASQKNFIALYHMGIYANEDLLNWFVEEFKQTSKTKLDMGKSCIRFKKTEHIPFELIGKLASKMTPQDWISLYESKFLSKKK